MMLPLHQKVDSNPSSEIQTIQGSPWLGVRQDDSERERLHDWMLTSNVNHLDINSLLEYKEECLEELC